jgi:hypothetical protein
MLIFIQSVFKIFCSCTLLNGLKKCAHVLMKIFVNCSEIVNSEQQYVPRNRNIIRKLIRVSQSSKRCLDNSAG